MTMATRSIRLALAAAVAALALPALAQMAPWEQALYDAAKKEGQFTVYTAHYDTETIADICAAFDRRYPGVKCTFVSQTVKVTDWSVGSIKLAPQTLATSQLPFNQIDGLLGSDVLSRYSTVQIDYDHGLLKLGAPRVRKSG